MKKTMLTGLVAIAAAAGLSCSNMPYSQRDTLEQNGTEVVYRDVKWDNSRLELAVRVVNKGVLESETVWTRYEPANSRECAKIELRNVHPVELQMSETEIIQGIEANYFSDESCDRTFENGPDIYVFSDDEMERQQTINQFRNDKFDVYMQTITSKFDIYQLVEDWHNAREL